MVRAQRALGIVSAMSLLVSPREVPTGAERFSLTVSPARLVLGPDVPTTSHRVAVTNSGSAPLSIEVRISEFGQGSDGRVRFARPGPLSSASWVTVTPSSFALAAGDRRAVDVGIHVPSQAEPGERQIALVFLALGEGVGGNVVVNRGVATQLLLGVPGPRITKIGFGRLRAPRVSDDGSVPFRLTVHNFGNVHRDLLGRQRLVARAGGRDVVRLPELVLLRGSTRVIGATWTSPPRLCRCRILVRSDDGQGRAIVAQAEVIVLPLRLAGAALVVVFGLLLLVAGRRRGGRDRR